jgi:uncharacterized protein (TIGR02246 family)
MEVIPMRTCAIVIAILYLIGAYPVKGTSSDARAEIEAFNHRLEDATRSMDNQATLALWADDGISLLPSTKPIVGKTAIASFLEGVTAQLHGAKMEKFELECFAIDVSGYVASEWCNEHQVVFMPEGKPLFDGRGKMLLVLRKGTDGHWRIQREMWNQA